MSVIHDDAALCTAAYMASFQIYLNFLGTTGSSNQHSTASLTKTPGPDATCMTIWLNFRLDKISQTVVLYLRTPQQKWATAFLVTEMRLQGRPNPLAHRLIASLRGGQPGTQRWR